MDFTQIGLFSIAYILGAIFVFWYRKKKDDPDIFFFECCWTIAALLAYLSISELRTGSFFILAPLSLAGLFLYSYFKNKHRLVNGLLFNVFILTFGIYLLVNLYRTEDILVGGILAVALVGFLFVFLFGLYGLIIFLYWNSIVVLRRESHSLANLLTLVLAIVLTILLVSDSFLHALPSWVSVLFTIFPASLLYFFVVFLNFLSISVIYQFNHPRYDQDFIIVLGAGLLNGEKVSPLLAQRIDKAIAFYHLQFRAKKTAPRLLMSGGQGSDEKIPEAVAMKEYAVSQGIPESEILVEANSTTTYENMKFSKEIMDSLRPEGYHAIFASNNYHIFRAGMYADQAHVKADGIGSHTAFYYLPNAFLREYIAILFMHKKRHALAIGGIASIIFLMTILEFFFGN
ncbi:YdcF family protein [Enterococcus gallinarum]|uniref:ElyC/SanA/YdcF family protein n=1 Tax=Enterococcus gallinarum TaxID=1353 RepID=A0A376H245_ENTGA|nr:ElyC/SanA/YdcF family protein [Enterococcus gallinarum]MCC4045473.1 YdcF family protein [Enterococcus gallinarum]MDT2686639.1 ElyC/SanA/YdcF family protein [Enterococcus gallinarum]MDT2689524.1 ElyC/SanA/YdcF family protein [Enterococcus gallinarum]OJG48808.1 membrane protein [Enterococcus gallinarum]STD72496.1 integral membrane protein [Enterococcus gallinarum]